MFGLVALTGVVVNDSLVMVDFINRKREGSGAVPFTLQVRDGDKVMIRNCGAYTSSYSSVGFNGFPPLDVIVL